MDLIKFIEQPRDNVLNEDCKSLKELLFLAKEKKTKRYYLMRKAELIDALEAVERQEPVKSPKRKENRCIHGKINTVVRSVLDQRFVNMVEKSMFVKNVVERESAFIRITSTIARSVWENRFVNTTV